MRRDVFQAIADPVRRDIIDILSRESLTVNEVAERFQISRPAISKHIKILSECNLVIVKQTGRERYCKINPSELVPAFMWLDQYKNLWEERIDAFEVHLKEMKHKKKNDEK